MSKEQKTLVIFADALSSNYLSDTSTPFLSHLAEKNLYVKEVIPSFGFCERIEFLNGKSASSQDCFTALKFSKNPDYLKLQPILNIFHFVEQNLSMKPKKFLRKLTNKLFGFLGIKMSAYLIPYNLLPFFNFSEDGPDGIGLLSETKLLNALSKKKNSVFYDCFTELGSRGYKSDEDRIEALVNSYASGKDVFLLYLDTLDKVGHSCGPNSNELLNALRIVDAKLEYVLRSFLDEFHDANIIILGDHGMLPVKHKLNVQKILTKIKSESKLNFPNECFWFLDSTLCRVWTHSSDRKMLIKALKEDRQLMSFGRLTGYEDIGIANGRAYGDIIWSADPGVIVFPDYFRYEDDEPVKGMHGYNIDEPQHNGMCIITNSKTNKHPRLIAKSRLHELCQMISENR